MFLKAAHLKCYTVIFKLFPFAYQKMKSIIFLIFRKCVMSATVFTAPARGDKEYEHFSFPGSPAILHATNLMLHSPTYWAEVMAS